MNSQLKGKTAIVTGGSRGIGKATCIALAKEGANVVIAARTEEDVTEVKDEIEHLGGKAIAIETDVRDENDVKVMVHEAIDQFGKIDILINNAGIAVRKYLVDTTLFDYESIMDTNVKGMFLCMKYVLPYMVQRDSGTIINISSGAGKSGIPQLAAYCASKFAVIGLTEAAAGEVSPNIRILALCPGGVDTKMYRSMFADIPKLKPEEVANKIVELCVEDNGVLNGSSIEFYE